MAVFLRQGREAGGSLRIEMGEASVETGALWSSSRYHGTVGERCDQAGEWIKNVFLKLWGLGKV